MPVTEKPLQPQRGFTLLEVLVAMALIGVGFASTFVAMSGSRRLTERALAHDAARVLAQARLDEMLQSPTDQLSDDGREERYLGQDFGYRINVEPVDLGLRMPAPAQALPFQLDQIRVEVFWGPQGQQRSLLLKTMRMRPRTSGSAAATDASAAPAARTAASVPGKGVR